MQLELIQGHNLQRLDVGCFQMHWWRDTRQKVVGGPDTNHMGSVVVFIGMAATIAKESGQRGIGTRQKRSSQNVQGSHVGSISSSHSAHCETGQNQYALDVATPH
jgi:hypothetical protein